METLLMIIIISVIVIAVLYVKMILNWKDKNYKD